MHFLKSVESDLEITHFHFIFASVVVIFTSVKLISKVMSKKMLRNLFQLTP